MKRSSARIWVVFLSIVMLALNASASLTSLDFNINNNATYTKTELVDLNLSAISNATFSYDANKLSYSCVSGTFTTQIDFAFNKQVNLFSLQPVGENCSTADGTKTIYVRVYNSDLNAYSDDSDSIILDKTKPRTTVSNIGYWSNANPFTVTFTCGDATSDCNKMSFTIDGNAESTTSSSFTKTIVNDGNHRIDFNSLDNAGNLEDMNTVFALIDRLAPIVSITKPNDGNSNVISRLVSFDLNRNGTIDQVSDINLLTLRVDVNSVQSVDFNKDTNCMAAVAGRGDYHCEYIENKILKTGDYNVAAMVQDRAGNYSQVKSVFHFVDATAPSAPSTPIYASYQSSLQSILVTWNVNLEADVEKYYVYRGDNSGFAASDQNKIGTMQRSNCTGSICNYFDSNTLVADKNYWYKLAAVDYSDNNSAISGASNTVTSLVSTSQYIGGLSVSISSGAAYATSTSVTLNLGASSASQCRYRNENENWGSWESYSTSRSWSLPSGDGSKTVYYQCKNSSDSNSEIVSDSITLDTSAPGVPGSLSASVSGATVSLSWSGSSDSTAGMKQYRVYRSTNAGELGSHIGSASGTSYSEAPSNGTFYYRVRAEDNAGNLSSESNQAVATVSVSDATAPTVNWKQPAAGATLNGTVSLVAIATDVGSGIRKVSFFVGSELIGEDFEGNVNDEFSVQWDTTSLAESGSYTLKAVATDRGNNTAERNIDVNVLNERRPVVVERTYNFVQPLGFESARISEMVKATLASEALVEEAAKLSSEAGVKRGIRATEVSSDGISQYRIDIVAGFVNETGLDALQLIEIVPSGFAAGPGEIVSSTPFEVLQTEPLLVIRFNLSGLKAGEAKDIVYGLKAMVGKQKADSLATELTLQEFVAPPILLAGTTAVDASSFKQPGLSAEASTLIIAVIVIVVVFLLLLVSLREGWLGGGAMPAKRKRWAYHGE